MLNVTSKNALDILKFASDNQLVRLKHVTLIFLANNTGSCIHHDDSTVKCTNTLNESHPGIGSELFELIKYNQGLAIIPMDRLDAADELIEKARVNIERYNWTSFLWTCCDALVTSILMSQIFINSSPPSPWIFGMNVAFLV